MGQSRGLQSCGLSLRQHFGTLASSDLLSGQNRISRRKAHEPAAANVLFLRRKAVQKACANDYRSHCGQYGIETDVLRLRMDKAGQALSKTCVDALVDAGEVSKAEVERRSGR